MSTELEVAGEEVSGCGSSVSGCLSQGGKLGQAWAQLRTGYEDVLHAIAWGGLSWFWPPLSQMLCPLARDSWPPVLV